MSEQNELSERLSALLADPEGLEKIKNMAANLFGGGLPESVPEHEARKDSLFGDIDIGSLTKIAGLLHSRSGDNDNIRLLKALKPHLSPLRQPRVDAAVKMLKLLQLAPMLSELGLFNL